MNVARHHAEWLSLVESSGPFLSLPVLMRVFPQGLDRRDPERAARLREAYEDWLDRGAKIPAVHQAWISHVLEDMLEYSSELLCEGQAVPPGMEAVMATFGEVLRPDLVLKHREANHRPVLLISIYPPGQDLEKPVGGKVWKASVGTRMMELLHATNVPLGLVTNGEQWMLVSARHGETTGFASWYADLWLQEPITLRAFHSLLHLRRLIGVAESDTLDALFVESSKDQQEVTDQLGYQVRQAVEVLVQAFDRIDAESGRTLLAGASERTLYDSALTIMMRLVFLFSAEERGLLLLGDRMYDQNYALSTLSQLLREVADQHGEEILERRHDAWYRLIATFRAVHGGVEHEAMRLPPYGGALFDPDRYPFLEGRAAGTSWRTAPSAPLPINNRVVLHLLEALQLLRIKVPGGGPAEARRLSFRALDIEQIGHVYEGLLDHTAKRASEAILGLEGSKDSRTEIPLTKLEEIATGGSATLAEFLHEKTGRSEKTLKRLVDEPDITADAHALLIACGQDQALFERVRPFTGLLRADSFGQPVVVVPGGVYVTSGSDRRSTGTHYTPRSLTEPIVKHTLEPLVYVGPAEGLPEEEWTLKSPKEILSLKVCDMAMGSGAFLVEACRYLADRLAEAWEKAEQAHPGSFVVTPDGELSEGAVSDRLTPLDSAERIAIARRYVADRCLYGVDINPMAVEMAKLSLWLITLQRDRPFSFLDHALKCGDSLLGVSSFTQVENFSLRPGAQQITFATANLFRYVEEATAKRRALEELPSNDHSQIDAKARLHAEAEEAMAKVRAIADCLIALELLGLDGDAYEDARHAEAEQVQLLIKKDADVSIKAQVFDCGRLARYANQKLHGRNPFHWPVEFPEVFSDGGFSAFVGNPPFMGGKKISGEFGSAYRELIVRVIANKAKGHADLSAYFLLKACLLVGPNSILGLLLSSSIAEGDTREVSLDRVSGVGFTMIRAFASQNWPGQASVTISMVWLRKGTWKGNYYLDNVIVQGISPYLSSAAVSSKKPFRLASSKGIVFIGSYPLGEGFVISPAEAEFLIKKNPENRKVLFPYLTGKDLNSSPTHTAPNWIINFSDWPLDQESSPVGYVGLTASDFPDCLRIVIERVKPERDRLGQKEDASARGYARLWWQFGRKGVELYSLVRKQKRVFAIATAATKYVAFGVTEANMVFSHSLSVVAREGFDFFAILSSNVHESWTRKFASYNLSLLRYTPTDCFETFPFPSPDAYLLDIGRRFHDVRSEIMSGRAEGLTEIYNRFHNPEERSEDISRFRTTSVAMDQAVAAAYDWTDLDLGHGFHKTKQGMRYTISEPARYQVLDRLLALNHQRYDEEVKAGLHEKGRKKSNRKAASPVVPEQGSLLD